MPSHLVALSVDAHDPAALARFWCGVLGWQPSGDPGGVSLLADDGTDFRLRFVPSAEPFSAGPGRMHLDLRSGSPEEQQQTVARALALGAQHLDVGQRPEEEHVVLADPEGNAFCVVEAGNGFLADCGFVGALSCDGTQRVGYFWSEALGWPLIWDQDEETAIRSPNGGPKISWGGPPVAPKTGRNRLHLDLAPSQGSSMETEVERLVGLGATVLEAGDRVLLADPDGNEFCVLPRW